MEHQNTTGDCRHPEIHDIDTIKRVVRNVEIFARSRRVRCGTENTRHGVVCRVVRCGWARKVEARRVFGTQCQIGTAERSVATQHHGIASAAPNSADLGAAESHISLCPDASSWHFARVRRLQPRCSRLYGIVLGDWVRAENTNTRARGYCNWVTELSALGWDLSMQKCVRVLPPYSLATYNA